MSRARATIGWVLMFIGWVVLAVALLAASGCTKDAAVAAPGESVSDVYVRDLRTGKCIVIHWGGGKTTTLRVAEEFRCGPSLGPVLER